MIKKKSKKVRSVSETKEMINSEISAKVSSIEADKKDRFSFMVKLVGVGLLGVGIFFFAQKYRGQFIAAMVNTKPITRWELNSKLTDRYGQSVLEEMIKETLVKEEATKNKIVVTEKELSDEFTKLETQSGGKAALMESAKSFGLTSEAQIKQYISFSLISKKLGETLFANTVTDTDVKKFYDDNKKSIGDKKIEEVKEEIKAYLIQSKMMTWVEELRTKSKVKLFI